MSSEYTELSEAFGLLEGHQVMLLLTLMIIGMLKMQFVRWMVKMDGEWSCLTTQRAVEVAVAAVEVVVEQVAEVVIEAEVLI